MRRLATLGTIQRINNPSLWDAITTAIFRRYARPELVGRIYHHWCLYGRKVDNPSHSHNRSLIPSPERVLSLPDTTFAEAKVIQYQRPLSDAATAYTKHHLEWAQLQPEDLAVALTDLPGIGQWTAGFIAADYTGDFSVYPHGDINLRHWAAAALTVATCPFPTKKPPSSSTGINQLTGHRRTCTP